ncbi:dihydrofolate reductase [Sphingobacterium sp. lm-10]|uniref:dihydrofolate reductase n=1 Tax=Sphingobacterium sp. lm-10 TaxID=2944904 RepID=UPI002021911A|nr:dihydrofolate reductase [Sphingobacterium sp. lm-10]MCL7986342.1 dihydrofolate reductase [Sphingobacterium sp. lm-10]
MNTIKITLIAAASENNVIGKDNKMAWHLPDDFRYFKNTTKEHSVVMGRKTFDSMGKALSDRRNIVITRDQKWSAPEVDVANSLEEVFTYCRDEQEIFIIGGAEIYKQALPYAHKILLTRVHTTIEGDAYFPEFDESTWKLMDSTLHVSDEKHAFPFTFQVYERIEA